MGRRKDLGSSLQPFYRAPKSIRLEPLFHQTLEYSLDEESVKFFFLGASTSHLSRVRLVFGAGGAKSLPLDLLEDLDAKGYLPAGILREGIVLVSSEEVAATAIEDLSTVRVGFDSTFLIAASRASLAGSRHCVKLSAISTKSKKNKTVSISSV